MESYDVAIIGGGFYGSFLAAHLASRQPELSVALLERQQRLFTRAATSNQGQLHLGYLYGGNPRLARECARTVALFERRFGAAVDRDVTAYYGIHRDSAFPPQRYEEVCAEVGLPLRRLAHRPAELFGEDVVAVYRTPEKTFNSGRLRSELRTWLDRAGVAVLAGTGVQRVEPARGDGHRLCLDDGRALHARTVFNAAFAGLNGVHERSGLPPVPTRYDVLLHFLVELPPAYAALGASVVAGPYAFLSPSTFHGAHILASGRHRAVAGGTDRAPVERVSAAEVRRRYEAAIAEAQQWIPVLRHARFRGHTLGTSVKYRDPDTGTESPNVVVLLDHGGVPDYHVVVAGRVSCMFDVIEPAERALARVTA